MDTIHWLGHSAFRWEGAKTVYFDPYKLSAAAKKADIIFVSHEHFDHCSKGDIAKIATAETVIVASADAARELKSSKISCDRIMAMVAGGSTDIGGVAVRAVPSYNIDKAFHPRASGKLGFLVTMDGTTVYHAGDTDFIPEMRGLKCDVALLPVSGTYVMTADEAVQAALAIKPKLAIPMHYGEVAGSPDDARRFQGSLAGRIEARILKKES